MSVLSDVQALYGGVRDTWSKSQAHVIAHVVLAGVVFWICGATIPEVSIPRVDPKQISDSEWFKLAKDTGIVYVSFVIPVVILAAYAALLRTGGQVLVAMVMLILPPSPRQNRYRLLTPWSLEPLALTLGKTDFHLSDLEVKSSEFALKYQSQKNGRWDNFQQSLTKLTKNAQVYLGDFLLFLAFWIILFKLLPQASWIRANESRFWPVALILLALAWFAWFRVSRAIAVLPSMLLMYVATMMRADPEMKAALDVSEATRENVRRTLEKLLQEQQERTDSRPSFWSFLRYKLGLHERATADEHSQPVRGLPFPTLYENGYRFSWDKKYHTRYDGQWLAGYSAYLYYRLHRRLSQLSRAAWQLARFITTGAP